MSKLMLASASPRRIALLRQIGLNPELRSPDIDETPHAEEAPRDYVRRMAESKARAVDAPAYYILAADTSVIIDQKILGKPEDFDDFQAMMARLSGRAHEVLTAVAVKTPAGVVHTQVERTVVQFVDIPTTALARYWQSAEPVDKAGGYGIQGLVSHWVSRIEGCYFNVVGLPLAATVALLAQAGYEDAELL